MKLKVFFSVGLSFLFIPAAVFPRSAMAQDFQDIELKPQATVSATFDDNLHNSHENTKSDFITAVSAGLSLGYKDPLKSFSATASATRQFFSRYSSLDNTSGDLGFSYARELSYYDRISLSEKFSTAYEAASFEEQFGRTLGRYRYYANEIIVEYIRDIAKQTQARAFYSNVIDAFSISGISDSYTNALGLQVDHDLSSQTTVLGAYELSRRSFKDGPDAMRSRVIAGLQQDLTKQLSMEATAGVDCLDSYRDDTLFKPYVSLRLANEFDSLTGAGVSFVRQYDLNPFAEDIFKEWRLSADFTRQPVKKFSYTASCFIGEGQYVASGLTDRLLGAGLECFYRLSEKVKLAASYQYSTVDSNQEDREYDKHKLSLGLRMEF